MGDDVFPFYFKLPMTRIFLSSLTEYDNIHSSLLRGARRRQEITFEYL